MAMCASREKRFKHIMAPNVGYLDPQMLFEFVDVCFMGIRKTARNVKFIASNKDLFLGTEPNILKS